MRAKPLVLVASLVLSGIATKGQKAVVAVTKDPQAVSILNQSLSAVGGVTTVNGIQDYTASGSIAYNWGGESVSGSATLRGMGISNFRLDANLPDGMRTYAVSGVSGVLITPDGTRQADRTEFLYHLNITNTNNKTSNKTPLEAAMSPELN